METLFFYFLKVILTSGVMFLYYRLFLKDKTFHHYNRFYLLAVMAISILLPLLKVSYFTLEVNSDIYLLINKLQNINSTENLSHDYPYFKFFAFGFGLVSVFYLVQFAFGIRKIQQFKKTFEKEHFEGINFYKTNLQEAPFSFFKNLFWKDSILIQSDLGRQILKHEMVHIEQKHSWDKIFIEILTSIFWFNPVFYIIRKEIHLIHEYLADQKAIKNADTKVFAQMLLASQFSGKHLSLTSPFLSSHLKKRLTMLKKSKTKFSYARRIFALPLVFTLAFIYLVNAKNREIVKTNLEIENLVSKLQSDTISKPLKPETTIEKKEIVIREEEKEIAALQNEINEKQKAVIPLQNDIAAQNEAAKKISEQMKLKSEALKKLSENKEFNSLKFQKLEKELDELGSKMDGIFNSEEFKNSMKKMDLNFAEMDQLYAKMDDYFNSEEFKITIKDAENKALETEKKVNSPEFKKRIKIIERKGKEAEKIINSAAFKQKIKDAEKSALDAVKRKENLNINLMDNRNENTNIFIDGKASTKEEMEKLSPDSIEMVNVIKNNKNGTSLNEIHITTKKK